MKKLIALAGALITLAGCEKEWSRYGGDGVIGITGYEPTKGGHCESSALMNALAALGYRFDEADIVGLGGAPSFVYLRQGFPFIGGRSADMRERFFENTGIEYRVEVPEEGADPWRGVFEALASGLPVPLRVDMRWLPYRYGGRFGPAYMSFGWHWVCLFKVDFEAGMAYVSDTEFPGLQAIRLSDLDRARSSKTKVWPPRREYLVIGAAPRDWNYDRRTAILEALAITARNYRERGFMEGSAAALEGLENFPGQLEAIGLDVNRFALPPAYGYMAATIERNGTGGSLFRRFYRDFLSGAASGPEMEGSPELKDALRDAAAAANMAASAWSALAAEFESAAGLLKKRNDEKTRDEAALRTAESARKAVDAERALAAALDRALEFSRDRAGS